MEGPLRNGMVIDFDELKSALKGVLKELDHTDLNRIFQFPSCENLCIHILERLRESIDQEKIGVRVW